MSEDPICRTQYEAVWSWIDQYIWSINRFVYNGRAAIIIVLLASVMEGMSTTLMLAYYLRAPCVQRDISCSVRLVCHNYLVGLCILLFGILTANLKCGKWNRKTQAKRPFHYFLLAALFLMLASNIFFWAGVLVTALNNQDGAALSLEVLDIFVDCRPTTGESSTNCNFETWNVPWKIYNKAPAYFTTVALVTAVCVWCHIYILT